MGLWSWLFPGPKERIAKARQLMGLKQPAYARDEVLGLDEPEALAVLAEAEDALVALNLEAALRWAEAGEDLRVQDHLELAERFHRGGREAELRQVRRQAREARQARLEAEQRAREEKARMQPLDPFGAAPGGLLRDAPQELPPDAEEEAMRLALLVEAVPEDLRGAFERLPPSFARAVLDLEDGRPDLALPELMLLPDVEPLVQLHRARCAELLGDPATAARALREVARLLGSHRRVGAEHTAAMLARVTASAGDVKGALRVLRDARASDPDAGGPLYAELLEATGELAEADLVLRDLTRRFPRERELYKMLARVRLKGGERHAAMQALEAGLAAVPCTPGKCGSQPPDPELLRTLAILYLEDGVDAERAFELARQLRQVDAGGSWEDAYLDALAARAENHPMAADLARTLWQHTPEEDPRRERLARHLGA